MHGHRSNLSNGSLDSWRGAGRACGLGTEICNARAGNPAHNTSLRRTSCAFFQSSSPFKFPLLPMIPQTHPVPTCTSRSRSPNECPFLRCARVACLSRQHPPLAYLLLLLPTPPSASAPAASRRIPPRPRPLPLTQCPLHAYRTSTRTRRGVCGARLR